MSFKRDFECPTGWSDCDSCKDKTGQEEDGTVICGRRPKQFSCMCGCKNFTLHRRTMVEVDFSQEGAIEGHPFIGSVSSKFESFLCFACGAEVPDKQAQEMIKEVV